jgi:hypothetical protein
MAKNRNKGLSNKTISDLTKALVSLNTSLTGIGGMGSSGGRAVVSIINYLKEIKEAIIACCIETNGNLQKNGKGKGRDDDDDKKESGFLERLASNFDPGKLFSVLNNLDKLQQRALATNTNLEQIQVTKGLGIRMSEMTKSLLDLRELGFRKVDDSTQKLISTMKMTNQNTAGLNNFLAKNSYYLNLSNSRSQTLVDSLTKTGVAFGVSQEKTIAALNAITQATKNVALFTGDGGNIAQSITTLIQQVGGRNEEELRRAVGMLFDTNNETLLRISGQTENVTKLMRETDPAKGAMMLRQILGSMDKVAKSMMGTTTDRNMFGAMNAIGAALGGVGNLQNLNVAIRALDENTQIATQNQQDSATFRTAEEAFYGRMEVVLVNLNNTLLKIAPGIVAQAGKLAGSAYLGGAAVKGGIGLLSRMGMGAGTGGAFGPWGAIIGATIGLGMGIYDWFEEDAARKQFEMDLQKQAAVSLASIDLKTPTPTSKTDVNTTASTLAQIINNQIQQLGPGDSTALQQKSIELFQSMVNKLDAIMGNTAPPTQVIGATSVGQKP